MHKIYLAGLLVLLPGCNQSEKVSVQMNNGFKLTSKGFQATDLAGFASKQYTDANFIHREHTCDGANESPQLRWENPPTGTKSFALICDDPDAPKAKPFVHWVIYNIPAGASELPEALPTTEKLDFGGSLVLQGTNDAQRIGFYGPCPPSGVHRYYFKLFALDRMLELAPGATKEQLEAAMKGHVLATAEIVGLYQRKK